MGRYGKQDIQTSIRAAATENGEPLTTSVYREWRRQQSGQIPSVSTIYAGEAGRYCSWSDACNDADVESVSRTDREEYTREHIERTLQAAAADIDGPVTIAKYESWRQAQSGSYPSRSVIFDAETARYDSWKAACADADVKHGRPRGE